MEFITSLNPNDYLSIPFLRFPDRLNANVLLIENWFDYIFATLYVG